jgi:long-chain acyl-CoA synthetase
MSHAANRPKASPAGGYPWEKSYAPGVTWNCPLPPAQPLASFLISAAERWPDRIGLDFYDRTFTYTELLALAQRAAKGLQAIGVGPGVNVGLHLVNSPHYIVCLFGILLAGGRVVNFSPLAARRELEYQLADSQTQVMITVGIPALYGAVAALKGKGRLRTVVVCSLDDFLSPELSRALLGPLAPRNVDPKTEVDFRALIDNDGKFTPHSLGALDEEVAVLQYTGGTTGEPKGAMLTHANFSSVLDIYEHWRGGESIGETEKGLLVLPLFHIFGLTSALLGSLKAGLQIVLLLRFDAERVLADIAGKRITRFSGVPTMYAAMINHPRVAEFDLSSLKKWGSGGAPMPADVAQRFRMLTGITPKEGYGLTETAPLATLQRHEGEPRVGTVGLPAPHSLIEIVSLEDDKTVLAPGKRGEICITGPQIMKGYWNKPEATAEALRDGRFHSGDIGFMDEEGFVTLVDRKKDMILSGGYNVFPRNIEEAIYEHPTVAECTVIGVPDPHRGQSAKAFIALKPGSKAFNFEELLAFLRDKLAKYELPAEMEIRDSLPKTGVGKLSKKELVAEELAKRAAKAS